MITSNSGQKIIIRLDTDDQDKIKYFLAKFYCDEFAVIPSDIKLLIKDKEGYWHEVE